MQGISRSRRKGGADKFIADNALVCEFHFIPSNINISRRKSRKSLKRITAPSFYEIKGRSSARERLTFGIRGTLEISGKRDRIPGDRFYAGNK